MDLPALAVRVCWSRSITSVLVMCRGSLKGAGRCPGGWWLPGGEVTRERHCRGRPVQVLLATSWPVCTRCTKLEGEEIFSFFFRLIRLIVTIP